MSTMEDIILRIKMGGVSVMSNVIDDLITSHRSEKSRMLTNYKRYMASHDPDGTPVFKRVFDDPNKINNKLNNAFDADIIDVKLGYMIGNPIIYGVESTKYMVKQTDMTGIESLVADKQAMDADLETVKSFNMRNNVEDLDGETLKMASVCAYGARLLYIGSDGLEHVMNVEPWECIFVNDGSLDAAQYALRYYEITESDNKIKTYVEWYDETNVYYYVSSEVDAYKDKERKTLYVPYEKDGKAYQPHLFKGVPLIQFKNNKELQGDCDKVYSLIDGYDNTLSDINSEIEQFRLAYLAFYGMAPDEKVISEAKKTGAFGMTSDSRVEFITKNLNDAIIEHHLDRIAENIYKFARSVDFSDEAFAGNVSGIAMKFKMFGLESKCIMSERKFTASLRNMYKVLSSAWQTKGSSIDYMNMTFLWTRNFPLNLLDESQTTMNFKGNISEKTRLSLLSFIDDPEKEAEQMRNEEAASGFVNLDEEVPENDQENEFGIQGSQPKGQESGGV